MEGHVYKQTLIRLMNTPKRVALLGATGSIGRQALQVMAAHPTELRPYLISGNNQAELLIRQAELFLPEHVVVANPARYNAVREALKHLPIRVHGGLDALQELLALPQVDVVLDAIVGYAGLRPALWAVAAGKSLALANKECLVVAGEQLMQSAREHGVRIIPVDSEHSAIYQCLQGEDARAVEKILLTASGGPFLGYTPEQLRSVTLQEALRHPQWSMGDKITIDSATLFNKGLEMIEACRLFNVTPDKVQILVHPQSLVHSMVQFTDGAVKAQIGRPDMRLPIQYALLGAQRAECSGRRVDFFSAQFTFLPPDREAFPCLDLAYRAMEAGGTAPCVLNAAGEVANLAFRRNQIRFPQIAELIALTLQRRPIRRPTAVEELFEEHREATLLAEQILTGMAV